MVQTRGKLAKIGTHIPPPTKCLLLALPAELRIRIYKYVLPIPSHILITRKGIRKKKKPGPFIFTCRQIKDEVLTVFFRSNTFYLAYEKTRAPLEASVKRVCRELIGQNFAAMKTIRVECYFLIELDSGLENYVIKMWSSSDRARPEPLRVTWLRELLDNIVAKAKEQGRTPVLDGYGLLAIMELLSNTETKMDLPFKLDAPLIATKAVSTRTWT